MRVSRRELLVGGSAAALLDACSPGRVMRPAGSAISGSPAGTSLESVLDAALAAAKRAGATYADARIVRRQFEQLQTREDHVVGIDSVESYGVGVRVVASGAWGFAASSRVDAAAAQQAAARAVEIARADAAMGRGRVELAPAPAVKDSWRTPMRVDPFLVPLGDKVEYLLSLWRDAKGTPGVKYGAGHLASVGEWKVFASTEGSLLEQSVTRVSASFTATAIDAASGEFESRHSEVPPMQAGWEYVTSSPLQKSARRIAEDAVRKLRSPSVTPGKRDLVVAPSNLWLTIHESVGHSTELDRALGYEANYAGTSFATPDKLGKLRYGPPHLQFFADKTTPGGLATCGYDDDGVKTQRWDLIKNGVLVDYQTTREQARWIGEKASHGTCYAQDYRSFPFQRMPNVSLAPSPKEDKLDDLLAGVDDGIYVTGEGSWSIDHQRYNFQFGGQMFYEIKGGKLGGTLRDVAYQSNSLDFWSSCDAVAGSRSWELFGAMDDGKGEPNQSNAVSHGSAPARFRKVNIVNTNARKRG